jgi:hypothetical protein
MGIAIEIDPLDVLRILGMEPAGAPSPVTGGWDTALFRFATPDGSAHALRVFRSPEQQESARRERIALFAAAAAGIPVPEVEAEGRWRDLPVVVLSWIESTTMAEAIQRRPWTLWRLFREFGRVQASINAVAAPPELRDPEGARAWVRSLDAALAARLQTMDVTFDTLAHLDYHPPNVMTDGQRITGVLDWANAAAADPRVDVARTAVILETAAPPPGRLRVLARFLRSVFRRAWLRGYTEVAGPLGDLAPFMVLAGLSRLEDLGRAQGRPGVWAGGLDTGPVRRWTERWKRRAGLA